MRIYLPSQLIFPHIFYNVAAQMMWYFKIKQSNKKYIDNQKNALMFIVSINLRISMSFKVNQKKIRVVLYNFLKKGNGFYLLMAYYLQKKNN